MSIEIGIFARMFAQNANYRRIRIRDTAVSLVQTGDAAKTTMLAVSKFEIRSGFIWDTALLTGLDGPRLTVGGLKKQTTADLTIRLARHIAAIEALGIRIHSMKEKITSLSNWTGTRLRGSAWVAYRHLNAFRSETAKIKDLLHLPDSVYKAQGVEFAIKRIKAVEKDPSGFRTVANERFVTCELSNHKSFFDNLLSPPTDEQRRACICDEDAALVVASAGSGKTTLLLTKIEYLLMKRYARPQEILVLVFNRDAKHLIESRVLQRTDQELNVHTFHSFGLEVLAQSSGKKPSIAPFVESDRALGIHIEKLLNSVLSDPQNAALLRVYFSEFLRPYRDTFQFKTQGDYLAYVKSQGPISLQGERLHSLEELIIANTLYVNGIRYQYERPYPLDTATINYRQYKPDFYLPEYDIYIEHFALNENGDAPSFFKNYTEGVQWKRELHTENETHLIETYSYEAKNGNLGAALLTKLKAAGVVAKPIPFDQLLSVINTIGYVSELANMSKTFLQLYKERGEPLDQLIAGIKIDSADGCRFHAFAKLFRPLYELYEQSLANINCIDFTDMIAQGRQRISIKKYPRTYKYLLIDEFQDISIGRADLLRAIKEHLDIEQIFAVGDDWQAINRFAGGDVTVMTSFEKFFGSAAQYALTQTFRFNNKINDVASKFIQKNPNQIPKDVKPIREESRPQVILIKPTEKSGGILEGLLAEISFDCGNSYQKILVLGRYWYITEEYSKVDLQKRFPNLEIEFSTVHSAKGQEANHVIVLGLSANASGKRGSGFPSEASDDPIFSYVLAAEDNFQNSEERRLFYVALTRTRGKIYIVSDPRSPSTFIGELRNGSYDVECRGFESQRQRTCPTCVTAPLISRMDGRKRLFLGCTNFPICEYTVDFCAHCSVGFLEKKGQTFICDNCDRKVAPCPECGNGFLVKKTGPYGDFWGCSMFRSEDCTYKQKRSPR